jgi:hypothetical protein
MVRSWHQFVTQEKKWSVNPVVYACSPIEIVLRPP